jgi:hypothetical protein
MACWNHNAEFSWPSKDEIARVRPEASRDAPPPRGENTRREGGELLRVYERLAFYSLLTGESAIS